VRALGIRFNPEEDFVPVKRLRRRRNIRGPSGSTLKPAAPGRYTIRLAVKDPELHPKRLESGYYARTVKSPKSEQRGFFHLRKIRIAPSSWSACWQAGLRSFSARADHSSHGGRYRAKFSTGQSRCGRASVRFMKSFHRSPEAQAFYDQDWRTCIHSCGSRQFDFPSALRADET